MTDNSWLEAVPKVELHLHVEGAIPRRTMWELIEKYGPDPIAPTFESLEDRFTYRDFDDFIGAWIWKNRFLREYEDITFISAAVARDLASQNVRYAEVFFSPVRLVDQGLAIPLILEAVRAGFNQTPEIEIALIPDLVRDYGPKRAMRTLRELAELKDLGIIGIGLGGSENRVPGHKFKKVYREARKLGFRTTAHAGEAAGSKSIWDVIDKLEVDRIGHGTFAAEDESLLDHIVEREIPIEICPISNVKTGVIASLEAHPVRRYFDRGMLITVNTDDPLMFGNSLADEYRALVDVHGFDQNEIRTLVINGVISSWLPADRKAKLLLEITSDPNWISQ